MNTLLRTSAAALAVFSLAAPAAAQRPAPRPRPAVERPAPNWPEATESFSHAARLGPNGTFDLRNAAGDVAITGGGGDQVRITATKRARHPSEAQARAALPDLRIAVSERGGNVEVRTEMPRRRQTWTSVDYVVTVPRGANVIVETVSGDMSLTNIDGELRVNTLSGNVTASDVRRIRQITTVSGDVEVADGEADELTARTVSGDLTLRNLTGRMFTLRTVNGDARLVDVQMDRAHLQSTAGNLEYAGRLTRSGRYEFQTHSGNIRLSPSGDPGFDLEASTFSGDLRSDFQLNAREQNGRRGRASSLRGTFGDAGAVLIAQSFSGDILIVRR